MLDGVSSESEDYRPRLSERKILQQQGAQKYTIFVNVTVKALYMCNVVADRECSLITLGYLLPTRDDKMAAM